ncbi:MAG: hypothetical protein KY459_07320 [Acidobacteria bacterium]|nr:hypothetical protein [Acidobacteriota bacterium]
MQTLKSRKLSPTDLLSSSLVVAIDRAPTGLSARSFQLGQRLQVTGSIGKTRDGGVGFVASTIQASDGGRT